MERKKRVLIVEDEKNIVDILRFNLQREGYETAEAYDGEAGLQLAETENPDLILLDVMLPKLIGYITKPFSMRELMARVKANIRRTEMRMDGGSSVMDTGSGLVVNTDTYQVTKSGKAVDLTQREYELLTFLASHPGKVYSRIDLMEQVWNYGYVGDDVRTVDVTVRRLREKIEDDPASPAYILTRRGVGYYFSGGQS